MLLMVALAIVIGLWPTYGSRRLASNGIGSEFALLHPDELHS